MNYSLFKYIISQLPYVECYALNKENDYIKKYNEYNELLKYPSEFTNPFSYIFMPTDFRRLLPAGYDFKFSDERIEAFKHFMYHEFNDIIEHWNNNTLDEWYEDGIKYKLYYRDFITDNY